MGLKITGLFHKVLDVITTVEKVFGILAMAFLILINVYGIGSRYLFNHPVIYVQELTILAGVWIFFVGMGLVFKVTSDITVEFFNKLLPFKIKLLNEILVDLLILLFTVILFYQTLRFIPLNRGDSPVLSFALELPDEIYFYPIALAAVSIFLTVFGHLMGLLASFQSRWKNADQGGM